jgi:thioredoxin-related protein
MHIRHIAIGLLLTLITITGTKSVIAQRPTVPVVTDLWQLSQQAKAAKLPVVMMFTSDHCPYCVTVEEDFLIPMLISGDYRNKALISKFKIDEYPQVIDFDGQSVPTHIIKNRYNIYLTPTVVFLDYKGRELSPRRIGLTTPDYYGGYLDLSIDESLQKCRSIKLC